MPNLPPLARREQLSRSITPKGVITMSTKKHERHHTSHIEKKTASIEPIASVLQPVSDEERSQKIQTRAYGLWEQSGKPESDECRVHFWVAAEEEINAAHASG
jgi:hypothetical protein